MLERTGSDPKLIGLHETTYEWNKKSDVVLVEGTGPMMGVHKPEYEWTHKTQVDCLRTTRKQQEFESINPHFSSINVLQVPLEHPRDPINYSCFYRYVVGGFVAQDEDSPALDIAFVYESDKTYGVTFHDLLYDNNEPGLVYDELMAPDEKQFMLNCLGLTHPVPDLDARRESLKKQDIDFLEHDLGLKSWKEDLTGDHFNYFIKLAELRFDSSMIRFSGPYDCYYKYVGLDDGTSYIVFCVYCY